MAATTYSGRGQADLLQERMYKLFVNFLTENRCVGSIWHNNINRILGIEDIYA